MLTSQQSELWSEYQLAESQGRRKDALRILNSFIDCLLESPAQDWVAWAQEQARRRVDEGDESPLRMPLFQRVVFPVLLRGHRQRHPGCTRWLAGLSQLLNGARHCQVQLPEHERTDVGLLWSALEQDRRDERAAIRLISAIDHQLDYAVHELPAGVLYGISGASADECLELQAELREFTALTKAWNRYAQYEAFILHCEFHFAAYRDYRLNSRESETYAEYLERTAARQTQ